LLNQKNRCRKGLFFAERKIPELNLLWNDQTFIYEGNGGAMTVESKTIGSLKGQLPNPESSSGHFEGV
jgi:hypothetical protein